MKTMLRTCLLLPLSLLALVGCDTGPTSKNIETITIMVTGDDYNWYFQYPGPDGVPGTEDDRFSVQDLYLPNHAAIRLILTSKDYLYSFALPELNLKEIAVPDLSFELAFNAGPTRQTNLLGDQFCGFAHANLKGKVHILDQGGGFYELMTSLTPGATSDARLNPSTGRM